MNENKQKNRLSVDTLLKSLNIFLIKMLNLYFFRFISKRFITKYINCDHQ